MGIANSETESLMKFVEIGLRHLLKTHKEGTLNSTVKSFMDFLKDEGRIRDWTLKDYKCHGEASYCKQLVVQPLEEGLICRRTLEINDTGVYVWLRLPYEESDTL